MIRIDLKTDKIVVGSRVSGTATWSSDGGKQPRKVEVVLRRRIEGKKREATEVANAMDDRTESRSQITVPFDFEIPSEGPPSYRGKLINIVWEIVANADLPFAVDQTETKILDVAPAVWTPEQLTQYWNESADLDEDDEEDDTIEPTPGTDREER